MLVMVFCQKSVRIDVRNVMNSFKGEFVHTSLSRVAHTFHFCKISDMNAIQKRIGERGITSLFNLHEYPSSIVILLRVPRLLL